MRLIMNEDLLGRWGNLSDLNGQRVAGRMINLKSPTGWEEFHFMSFAFASQTCLVTTS